MRRFIKEGERGGRGERDRAKGSDRVREKDRVRVFKSCGCDQSGLGWVILGR